MGEVINIMMNQIEYIGEEADEDFAPISKANEVDNWLKVKIEMRHDSKSGHFVDLNVKQGFVKTKTSDAVLVVESITHFKIEPYDKNLFKKPASLELTKLALELIQIACHHNRGIFAVVRDNYGMKHAMPCGIHPNKIKSLIWEDLNRELLS